LPLDDRPREKLILKGANALSDSELLAILLRTGIKGKSVIEMARDLLEKHGSLANLATKPVSVIKKSLGVGDDKAAALAAAFEIGRRIKFDDKWFFKNKIISPGDVAGIFIPLLRDKLKEIFYVICLNSSNMIIRYEEVSVGSLNSSVVYPREVFKAAIENSSANIILLHNHPSGNAEPSPEDIQLTKKLCHAGEILDIKIFDHIIIAGEKYTSFVDKGLM
jgi:DNA repair protein RadC